MPYILILAEIAICILLSVPIPAFLVQGGGFATMMAYLLILLIPITVFLVLFLLTSNESEFKGMRILVALLLWSAFFTLSFVYNNFWGLVELAGYDWGETLTIRGYEFNSPNIVAAIFAIYNAIAIGRDIKLYNREMDKWQDC